MHSALGYRTPAGARASMEALTMRVQPDILIPPLHSQGGGPLGHAYALARASREMSDHSPVDENRRLITTASETISFAPGLD